MKNIGKILGILFIILSPVIVFFIAGIVVAITHAVMLTMWCLFFTIACMARSESE